MAYSRVALLATIHEVTHNGATRAELKLPFKYTAHGVVFKGDLITYRLKDFVGQKALAVVGFSMDDILTVKEYTELIGTDWAAIKESPEYSEHWTQKKSDIIVSSDIEKKEVVYYDGLDKDELTDFVKYNEAKVTKIEVKDLG